MTGPGEGGASDAPDLTVVVMAYNEAQNLEPAVQEILGVLERLELRFDLLIVDDGSTDGTGELADHLAVRHEGIRVIHHAPNEGLGGVYRTGFAQARGRNLTFFPADGQFPPQIIADFLPFMRDYDLVLGYLPDRRPGPVGVFLSLSERVLYKLLFGGFPKFQGIMMIRTPVVRRYTLRSSGRGWAVLMELILRATRDGARTVNRPTPVRPRMSGQSKVNNLRTVWSNLKQAVALRELL